MFSVWAYRLVRYALAILFVVAGCLKLSDPRVFAVTIDAFGILPTELTLPLAVILPVVEILAAVALVFDVRGSLAVISGLLIVFMAVLIYAIHMGLDIDCGCYGPEEPEAKAFHSLWTSLYRDIGMSAGVIYLYIWRAVRKPRLVSFSLPFFHNKELSPCERS